MTNVEKIVRDYYDKFGWVRTDGASGEDLLFRQYSAPYYHYHHGTIDRTVACFSDLRGKLLIAGGGDLPESHIKIANKFTDVLCLDISQPALDIAKEKMEYKAEYVLGSILDIPLPNNYFDAAFCAHVIYHIDIELQEKAINELIRVTKHGGRIVIIYGNPHSLIGRIIATKHKLPFLWKLRRSSTSSSNKSTVAISNRPPLYFALHQLHWWRRFEPKCQVSFMPWDVMGNNQERELLWNDPMAALVYRMCSWFESKFPSLAVKWWQYAIIILEKRSEISCLRA